MATHAKKKKNNHIDMASWKIDGETMETVTEFIFMGSKSLNRVSEAMQLKDTCSLEEKTEQT